MSKKYVFFTFVVLIFLAACKGQEAPLDLQNPFIGGTDGVVMDFQQVPKDVFDGGRNPFDIVIKLENKGEADVLKNKLRVKLSGFNPASLGKLEEQLSKNPVSDLSASRKDASGNIVKSSPDFVEFNELNHVAPIVGATEEMTVRAEACYTYKTLAVGKLCVRSNILNPEAGGICETDGNKPLFSSSSPVQFDNLVESVAGKDKIGFVFEVKKPSAGYIFETDSICSEEKSKENRVYVKVNSKLNGLSCTGLSSTSASVAEGFVTLFENSFPIYCKQQVSTRTDFEQVINIEAVYDFEDFKEVKLTVKSSGESSAS